MHNGSMASHTPDLFDHDQSAWLEDLQEDLLCLVLHSTSAALLQETSHTLQTLWLQTQAGRVESFDGSHCQDIIRRFNELVATYSASIAALPADSGHPKHLWIVHHAQSLAADQVHLLGQMLVHLPGVNIRMVLLHEGPAPISNWSEATHGQADIHELVPPPRPSIDLIDFAADPDENAAPHAPGEDIQASSAQHHRRHWIMAGAAGVALFTLGFALGRISQPELLSEVPVRANMASIPAPTEPPLIRTSQPYVAPAPVNATPAESVPPAASASPLASDMQWLRKLPSSSFVVVHRNFADMVSAQTFKSKHPILKTARIIPLRFEDKAVFAVISGPFRSEARTRGFMSRLEWKKSARVEPHQNVLDTLNTL